MASGNSFKPEWGQIWKTFQLLSRSQLGYQGRLLQSSTNDKLLQTAVMGGTIVKPFDPEYMANLGNRFVI